MKCGFQTPSRGFDQETPNLISGATSATVYIFYLTRCLGTPNSASSIWINSRISSIFEVNSIYIYMYTQFGEFCLKRKRTCSAASIQASFGSTSAFLFEALSSTRPFFQWLGGSSSRRWVNRSTPSYPSPKNIAIPYPNTLSKNFILLGCFQMVEKRST